VLGLHLYSKAQNKWWDGYAGNESVLLEDLDKGGECLGHLLKIWLDIYPCRGEVKGGQVVLKYQKFYITSNYRPEEIFTEQKILDAILRRITCIVCPPRLRISPYKYSLICQINN